MDEYQGHDARRAKALDCCSHVLGTFRVAAALAAVFRARTEFQPRFLSAKNVEGQRNAKYRMLLAEKGRNEARTG
jgi:hypothetical protein